MERYPRQHDLSEDLQVTLRVAQIEDVESLFLFFNELPEEERQVFKNDVTQMENIRSWMVSREFSFDLRLIAEKDGNVIGLGSLYHPKRGWSRHVGECRVWVHKSWRRKGLGQLISRELMFQAIRHGLAKIQVKLADRQVPSIKMWEKLGMQREAVLAKHVMDLKGRKRNLVIMGMLL